jgi:hypothetical protein
MISFSTQLTLYEPGLPDGIFSYQTPQFWYILKGLFEIFVVICFILRQFMTSYIFQFIFSSFLVYCIIKLWQPWNELLLARLHTQQGFMPFETRFWAKVSICV